MAYDYKAGADHEISPDATVPLADAVSTGRRSRRRAAGGRPVPDGRELPPFRPFTISRRGVSKPHSMERRFNFLRQ